MESLQLLSEDEYLDILDRLPKDNQSLDDSDPEKFIAGMGAEAIYTLLSNLNLDEISYDLRHKTESETSQQRKAEALKRLSVIEGLPRVQGHQPPRVDDHEGHPRDSPPI